MKCPDCQGTGSSGVYDGERVNCGICDGVGRVRFMDDASLRVSVWWDHWKDRLALTRLGRWWWRAHLLESRARKLAKRETSFQLAARHGKSINRMKIIAKALEEGHNVEWLLEKERRYMALYDLACKMRAAHDKWDPEMIGSGHDA